MNRIKEIFDYKHMIKSLVRRELRGRYQKSVLGMLWTLINPLFQIAIYTVVFSVIFPSSLENYYLYLTSGIIPWTFFSDAVGNSTNDIVSNADLTKKIYFPRETLPISSVTAKLINLLLAFIIVFIFAIGGGVGISLKTIWFLPVVIIIEYILALGFALLFSSLTVYFQDLQHIVTVFMMAWICGTPIMYTIDTVPSWLRVFISLNPMTGVVGMYHDVLYYQQMPPVYLIFKTSFAAVVVLVIGEIVFVQLEKNFAEEL